MKREIEPRLQGNLLSNWCARKAAKSEQFLYQTGFESTSKLQYQIGPHKRANLSWHNGKLFEGND